MAFSVFLLGSLGFLFCTAFGHFSDDLLLRAWSYGFGRLRLIFARSQARDDLPLVQGIIASVRAGQSLDSALDTLLQQESIGAAEKRRINALLRAEPEADFLSSFLAGALQSGIPVLGTLQLFQGVLRMGRKVKTKAQALTGQSRAQAEVLSWLPWTLLAALALTDGEWLGTAIRNSGSWLCWALALALLGAGRAWMRSLLEKVLEPKNREEKMQEELLPELILRLLAQVSLGQDADSALEACLEKINRPELSSQLRGQTARTETVAQLYALLQHCSRTGAPLREDLTAFLSDLYVQMEGRWEERAQRLPVTMMAPLFLCFFPACILVLLGLVVPLALGLL